MFSNYSNGQSLYIVGLHKLKFDSIFNNSVIVRFHCHYIFNNRGREREGERLVSHFLSGFLSNFLSDFLQRERERERERGRARNRERERERDQGGGVGRERREMR